MGSFALAAGDDDGPVPAVAPPLFPLAGVTTESRPLSPTRAGGTRGWGPVLLAAVGVVGFLVAVSLDPHTTGAAAAQVWSPFVLVAGLLLVGLVAEDDGLFRVSGFRLARLAPNGVSLFVGAAVLVALVTAVLNLDTSVVFLTPVLVHAARSRGADEKPLLYGCLLLSNAASLLLPGSNLTNLIVAGHLHVAGASFFLRMAPAWIVAVVVTAVVVGLVERRSLGSGTGETADRPTATIGLGLLAVVAVAVLVLVLRSPAAPVALVGVVVTGARLAARRTSWARTGSVLGLPVLVGLFGVAVTLGSLGRSWSGPATLLTHLDAWGTAALAAASTVLVNNLPAASLLAARVPPRPYALLIGLDIGPNLFVTGSLAWILWLRAARNVGAEPSVARASFLGLLSVPLSMAGALGILGLAGAH